MDLLYQNNQSTQSQTHHGYGGYGLPAHPAQPCGSLFAPVREPAGALGTEFARMALGKADSDDEDADSEAERQQALASATETTDRNGKNKVIAGGRFAELMCLQFDSCNSFSGFVML